MDPIQDTEDALRTLKQLKETLVKREGIGSDLPIMVLLIKDGIELLTFSPHGADYHRQISLAISMSDCDQVMIGADAYCSMRAIDGIDEFREEYENYEAGNLAERFARGDGDVIEIISCYSLNSEGHYALTMAPYRYDGRRVLWDDEKISAEAAVDGALTEAVEIGFGLQDKRTGLAMTPEELADWLGVDVVHPEFARPPRNGPCPCGSGVKAKNCCWK